MKKAKEYVKEFEEAGKSPKALTKIAAEMFLEAEQLMITRRAKSNESMLAVLNELDDKFRSFARQVGVEPDGFAACVKEFSPDGYCFWVDNRPNMAIKRNSLLSPRTTLGNAAVLSAQQG